MKVTHPDNSAEMDTAVHTLQNFVLPKLGQAGVKEMYARWNDGVRVSLSEQAIYYRQGGFVRFDTYFNGLTVLPWKKECPIGDLAIRLSGEGHFQLRIGLHRLDLPHRWLSEKFIDLKDGVETEFAIEEWPSLEDGILYATLEAIDDGVLKGGRFVTRTAPANDVRLGIVVTHFNRKAYVVPAIKRIREELLTDPALAGRIELIVVDNSQNLTAEEAQGATLIPNRNLGGSGGFTRGLMHLEDTKRFTHCMFMDDDASCEIESLKRVHVLLSYAQQEKFAIAGSLLREIEPYRMSEKGACFDKVCHPLKTGLDMRKLKHLLQAEGRGVAPDYGGWWLFAFALADVRHYPFPYFVHNDDITFSLMHKFNILTMNGISCWGEDFALKIGPLPRYLDVRGHILIQLLVQDLPSEAILKSIYWFLKVQLRSYNYASASAINLAFKHVLEGPDFWKRNLDTGEVRRQISSLEPHEKLVKSAGISQKLRYADGVKRKWWEKYLFRLSLGGLILPHFVLKRQTIWQVKDFHAKPEKVFRFHRIYYCYPQNDTGYFVTYDLKRTLAELFEFYKNARKFRSNFQKLKAQYGAEIGYMTSRAFWDEVYSQSAGKR